MFEKILVCLDGSNLAEQILPYAIEEALHFNSKISFVPGSYPAFCCGVGNTRCAGGTCADSENVGAE